MDAETQAEIARLERMNAELVARVAKLEEQMRRYVLNVLAYRG